MVRQSLPKQLELSVLVESTGAFADVLVTKTLGASAIAGELLMARVHPSSPVVLPGQPATFWFVYECIQGFTTVRHADCLLNLEAERSSFLLTALS